MGAHGAMKGRATNVELVVVALREKSHDVTLLNGANSARRRGPNHAILIVLIVVWKVRAHNAVITVDGAWSCSDFKDHIPRRCNGDCMLLSGQAVGVTDPKTGVNNAAVRMPVDKFALDHVEAKLRQ